MTFLHHMSTKKVVANIKLKRMMIYIRRKEVRLRIKCMCYISH